MKKTAITLIALALTSLSAYSATTKKTTTATTKMTTQTVKTSQAAPESHVSLPKASNGFTNELLVNLSESKLSIGKNCSGCDTKMELSAVASYLRFIQDKIQLGTEAGVVVRSGGGSNTTFELMGVGVYNIDSNFSNSPYAKLGLGLQSVDTGTSSEAKFAFFVAGGKRFSVFSNLNYSPELRISKIGDTPISFDITILSLSVNWN